VWAEITSFTLHVVDSVLTVTRR